VDDPTIALIGDASRLGSQNREWITSDDQLKQIVAMGANGANVELVREMRELKSLLSGQTLETTLAGEDILISMKRTQYNRDMRRR
jgi:hypothetical protein